MKMIWQAVGRMYMFFHQKKWLASLLFVFILIAQFVIIIMLSVSLNSFRQEFKDYRDMSGQRLNQVYSYLFVLNTNFNQFLEKNKK